MQLKWMIKNAKEKNGNTVIFLAISIVVLIGFAALVMDVGMMTFNKSKLQNAADAAALAGAQEIPESTSKGETKALEYLANNDEAVAKLVSHSITFAEPYKGSYQKIIVEATYKVDFMFAKIIGMDSSNVKVRAAATNLPASDEIGGLRPFGVLWDGVTLFQEGKKFVLKIGAGDPDETYGPGNFGPVGLDGTGGNVYSDTILNGSNNEFSIGDKIKTETGNMIGPTLKALNDLKAAVEAKYGVGSPIIIYVPLVDTLDVSGSKPVTITGFASFKITNWTEGEETVTYIDKHGKEQTKKVKKGIINAEFTKYVTPGLSNPGTPDTGLRVVNLVE